MLNKIKGFWLNLPLEWKKRMVSFLRVFISAFVVLVAAQVQLQFPESWSALGAVLTAAVSSAIKEGLDAAVKAGKAGKAK